MAVQHIIEHELSQDLARKATDRAFEVYAEKFKDYSPQAEWVSDTHSKITFKAKGFTMNGDIELKPKALKLQLDVPFVLKPFQKRAMGVIDKEIRGWIVKAKAGELD